MKQLARVCLIFVSLTFLTAHFSTVNAQVRFPSFQGVKAKYSAYIDMPQGYVSGVCVLSDETNPLGSAVQTKYNLEECFWNNHFIRANSLMLLVM